MSDVASDNTSLLAAQLLMEFLGHIADSPSYQRRHAGASIPDQKLKPT